MSLLSPQMSLLVQPLHLPPGHIEEVGLESGMGILSIFTACGRDARATFLPRLVDVFEGLERKNGGADFAGLAVPDEFDLAFVGEEEEAVFLRERFAVLDELDEVALLGGGEVVVLGGVGAGHGVRRCYVSSSERSLH